LIAGNFAGVAADDPALLAAGHVPDRVSASVTAGGTLDLVTRRSSAPDKVLRKFQNYKPEIE
jgi:hypothetical protein